MRTSKRLRIGLASLAVTGALVGGGAAIANAASGSGSTNSGSSSNSTSNGTSTGTGSSGTNQSSQGYKQGDCPNM